MSPIETNERESPSPQARIPWEAPTLVEFSIMEAQNGASMPAFDGGGCSS